MCDSRDYYESKLTLEQKKELVLAEVAKAFRTYGLTMNREASVQVWLAVRNSTEEGICSKSST